MSARQREELRAASRVVSQEAVDGRRDGAGSRCAHASNRHAQVFGFEHHADPFARQVVVEPVGDLFGQPLLHLEVA